MKRFLTLMLCFIIALCVLTGCTSNADLKPSDTTTTTAESTTAQPDNEKISPMLWRVTGKNGETMYLFGTIHVGDERNKKALSLITDTVDKCDALAVEFDMIAYKSDQQLMAEDMKQFVYTDGSVITDYIPKELHDEVVKLLREAKLYSSSLKYYNAAMWSQYVDQAALALYSTLVSDYGMDNMLLERAYIKDMEVLSIESGSFQSAMINGFSDELYILMMESILEDIDEYGTDLEELYSLWLSGDFEEFSKHISSDDYSDLTAEQIALIKHYEYKISDERNVAMGDKAIEYLNSGKTVFYAVGAAHMVGETGLVNRLTQEGYTIERIYLTEAN